MSLPKENLKRGNLIVESEELLALDLFEKLGVGWVSRGTSWDTKWHDGAVLFISNDLDVASGLTAQVSGKPRSSLTFPSALGSNSRLC